MITPHCYIRNCFGLLGQKWHLGRQLNSYNVLLERERTLHSSLTAHYNGACPWPIITLVFLTTEAMLAQNTQHTPPVIFSHGGCWPWQMNSSQTDKTRVGHGLETEDWLWAWSGCWGTIPTEHYCLLGMCWAHTAVLQVAYCWPRMGLWEQGTWSTFNGK